MPHKDIFCNIPWYEIHINHDGSYDLCGCMSELITQTPAGRHWNIKNYSVGEYWNSRRLRDERLQKLSDVANPACGVCQYQDSIGNHSKRVKENLKSVIFYDRNFAKSFHQSPHRDVFKYSYENDGATTTEPVSYHLSLGNECDLACVMCSPNSSYKLARDYQTLGWLPEAKRLNWTDDEQIWTDFTDTVIQNRKLVSFHIIGGEPTINKRFSELILKFVEHDNVDFSFSFTTNGMHLFDHLWPALSRFKRVEVGISLETVTKSNDYVRYGSQIETLLSNIEHIRGSAPDNVNFVVRTVPTLLTITEYDKVIRWCWEKDLLLNSYFAVDPPWQQIRLLPDELRGTVKEKIESLLAELQSVSRPDGLTNFRNPERVTQNCIIEAQAAMVSLMPVLEDPAAVRDSVDRFRQLDRLRGTDVREAFPILREWFDTNGY